MQKIIPIVLVILLAMPAAVLAVDMTGSSKTYLQLRETVSDETLAPLYEYLDVKFENIGERDISLHASGWFRLDLADESSGEEDFDQDLNYAYLSVRLNRDTFVNVGRVLVFEGIASEQVDGGYLSAAMPAGFQVAVFGGSPVETDFDDRDGDFVYGARLSQGLSGKYRVGASYINEENDSATFREELGLDVWVSPIRQVQVQGVSSYNSETSGWMEHTYYLNLGPFEGVRINGEYSKIDYEDFFFATTLSAFDIASIDPRESVQIFGGSVNYSFAESWTVAGDYRNLDYDLSGNADNYGVELSYLKSGYAAGVAARLMDGQTDELEYTQYRAYASKKWDIYDVTIDLFDVNYDKEINDVKNAYAIVGAFGMNPTENLRVGADVEIAENPFFDTEVKGFFKLIYKFSKGS